MWIVHFAINSRCGGENWSYVVQCHEKERAIELALSAWEVHPYAQVNRKHELIIETEKMEQPLPFLAVYPIFYEEWSR